MNLPIILDKLTLGGEAKDKNGKKLGIKGVSKDLRFGGAADIMDLIRTDAELKTTIAELRTHPHESKEYVEAKKLLSWFIPSGCCTYRESDSMISLSSACGVDLDGLTPELLAKLLPFIKAHPHVLWGFISPSGAGIKLGTLWTGVEVDGNDAWKVKVSEPIFAYWNEQLKAFGVHVSTDPQNKDISRACFLSSDPVAWHTPTATPLMLQKVQMEPESIFSLPVTVTTPPMAATTVAATATTVSPIVATPATPATASPEWSAEERKMLRYLESVLKANNHHETRLKAGNFLGCCCKGGLCDKRQQALAELERLALKYNHNAGDLRSIGDGVRNALSDPKYEGIKVWNQKQEAVEMHVDATTKGISATDLMNTEFPPLHWIVPGFLPAGLTLLAAKPKCGKSWLSLNIAASLACPSKFPLLGVMADIPEIETLYFAFEDGKARLKKRLEMLGFTKGDRLDRLHFVFEAPEDHKKLLSEIKEWKVKKPGISLVVIDTIGRCRKSDGRKNLYHEDTEFLSGLQSWAISNNIGVLCIHHVNKTKSEDIFESISGSQGLSGVADTLMVMTKPSDDQRKVELKGRDIEGKALGFNFCEGVFEYAGDAQELRTTAEERKVLEALEEFSKTTAVKLSGLCTYMNTKSLKPVNKGNLFRRLERLIHKGRVMLEDGIYAVVPLKATATAISKFVQDRPETGFTPSNCCSRVSETYETSETLEGDSGFTGDRGSETSEEDELQQVSLGGMGSETTEPVDIAGDSKVGFSGFTGFTICKGKPTIEEMMVMCKNLGKEA